MHMPYKLIALAAGIALVALFLLPESEEEKILAKIEDVRTLAEIHAPESSIEQLVTARLLSEHFTESTLYDLSSSGHGTRSVPSRQELVRRIAKLRAPLASLELALQDMQVSIEDNTASVLLRGSGLGSIRGEDGRFLEIHSAEIHLEKVDDTWLIAGGRHIRDERQAVE